MFFLKKYNLKKFLLNLFLNLDLKKEKRNFNEYKDLREESRKGRNGDFVKNV